MSSFRNRKSIVCTVWLHLFEWEEIKKVTIKVYKVRFGVEIYWGFFPIIFNHVSYHECRAIYSESDDSLRVEASMCQIQKFVDEYSLLIGLCCTWTENGVQQ